MAYLTDNELISVIVPVYKVEQYLDRCVMSIVCQTYKNIEIILVDDESPDRCPEICEAWAKKDNRIKVLHKKNGGLSDARNAGLRTAAGRFICFVDSDDYIAADFVEKLYDLIAEYHVNISAVGYQKVTDHAQPQALEEEPQIQLFNGKNAIEELFRDTSFCNYAWNKMYERSLFSDIEFPFGRKMEDLGTTYKLLIKSGGIAYCAQPLYFYYQREDSILHCPDKSFYSDKFQLALERYDDVRRFYPDIKGNDRVFLEIVLDSYPILWAQAKDYPWRKTARAAYRRCKKTLDKKSKIKYWLFAFNGSLYRAIRNFNRREQKN